MHRVREEGGPESLGEPMLKANHRKRRQQRRLRGVVRKRGGKAEWSSVTKTRERVIQEGSGSFINATEMQSKVRTRCQIAVG